MTQPHYIEETFFERHSGKIEFGAPSGCWLWSGGIIPDGYGTVYADKKTKYAHRIAYEAANGPIPAGLYVLHKCDTPACVNPDHLELGTQSDNMRDSIKRGRSRPNKGAANPRAKITEDDVRLMRSLYVPGHPEFGCKALAKRFGLSANSINPVLNRRSWKHV